MARAIPSSRLRIAEGTYAAVCVGIYELGTQDGGQYEDTLKIQFNFEIPELSAQHGRPVIAWLKVPFKASPNSKLIQTAGAWVDIKGGVLDETKLLRKAAIIEIQTSDDGEWDNIVSVSNIVKGTPVGKPTAAIQALFLDETFDQDVFDSLPEGIKKTIAKSPEFANLGGVYEPSDDNTQEAAPASKPGKKPAAAPAKPAAKPPVKKAATPPTKRK